MVRHDRTGDWLCGGLPAGQSGTKHHVRSRSKCNVFCGVPDRIAQLLDKLIDNALRFGSQEGSIVVGLRGSEGFIWLSVANEGSTLLAHLEDRLFDPMVSSAKDAGQTNLGLGLYIVRLIAEFHGGNVVAENRKYASGVEVIATLPHIEKN